MATADISASHKMIAKGICEMSWTATKVTGVGFAMNAPNLPDKTVHVLGVTGGTTQVIIEGTNATSPTVGATQWTTLVDPQGTDLDFTNRAIETILENPRYIRPRWPVATGGHDVSVVIIARGGLR